MAENLMNVFANDAKAAYRNQHEQSKKLIKKWERTGLLEGIKHEYDRSTMAVLLENQARQLVTEVSRTGTAQYSEEWSGVALPLVRRVFAEIAAKEFVSVQAMTLPSGLVFYLDFKYGSGVSGFTTSEGTSDQWGWQENSVYGKTSVAGEPSGGLYGAGKFGYSINQFTTHSAIVSTGSAAWSDVNYDPTLSASIGQYKKVVIDMATANMDPEGVRAFALIDGAGTAMNLPTYTAPVYASSAWSRIQMIVTNSIEMAPSTNTASIEYNKQPGAYSRGDFEATGDPSWGNGTGVEQYDPSAGSVGTNALQIPELNVSLRSVPIVAKTRKLKTVWTPEFAQDLNAYHSIDAEAELTSLLSEYMTLEIDLEILDMLIENAITVDYWNAQPGKIIGATQTNGESDWQAQGFGSTSMFYTQPTWFQTLGIKLQKVSNLIHKKTLRGGANFIVLGPTVATIIESIPGFAGDTDGNQVKFEAGIQRIGSLSKRYTVYKNPYMKEDTILMGFRGTQFLETGAVFAPYIPLIMTPLIYDPVNFTPRKGVMTRYAKKVVRPEFYGKIFVGGTNYI